MGPGSSELNSELEKGIAHLPGETGGFLFAKLNHVSLGA